LDYPALPDFLAEDPTLTPEEVAAKEAAFLANIQSATPTSHFPEFFGDIILVNGKAWPKLDVEPRQYRFRLLNGSDSRLYTLRLEVADPITGDPSGTALPFFVIGNELGLLNKPAVPTYLDPRPSIGDPQPNALTIAPGERYDIVVDFQALNGKKIIVTNSGNEPFPDAEPPGESVTQIMRFDVVKTLNRLRPRTTLSATTDLRPIGSLPAPNPATATKTRRLVLVEGTDGLGRLMTMIGPVAETFDANDPNQGTMTFKDPITEKPALNTTEIWEFYNATVDAHPIHMHLVDFRILDRQTFDSRTVEVASKTMRDGIVGGVLNLGSVDFGTNAPVVPHPEEAGKKDTAIMYPGTVTRLLVTFKRRGEYVYHCHILSHEDHEMMRPYQVV
jgi:spore coat protein A